MTDSNDSLCFGLLAGGRSSRMGVDKATLTWKGKPLWQHQLRLASEIEADEILISGQPEGPYRAAAPVVVDELPGRGPLAGVVSMLAAMKSQQLIVVAVDMPWLEASTLKLLLAEVSADQGVVPADERGIEPLAAVYPRELLTLARKILNSEDHSMHALVQEAETLGLLRTLRVGGEHAARLRSVNTPADWLAAAPAELEAESNG